MGGGGLLEACSSSIKGASTSSSSSSSASSTTGASTQQIVIGFIHPLTGALAGLAARPATVLAPMAGVTDTVFRRFIRNLGGCGLIMTEFTSADGVLRKKDEKAKRYLPFLWRRASDFRAAFRQRSGVMAEAARMVEGLGFDWSISTSAARQRKW